MKKNNVYRGLILSMLVLIPALMHAQTRISPELIAVLREAGLTVQQQPVPIKDFSVRMLDGRTQFLSSLKGKVVLLNFWATWCGPCRSEMPSMEIVYQRFKGENFEMLAIDLQESNKKVSSFINALHLNFPVGLDLNGKVASLYNINALPTTYIIDRDGFIIASVVGSKKWDTPQIFSAIERLITYRR